MGVADRYTYRFRWSAEDDAYVGTVVELPSLSYLAGDHISALQGIYALAIDATADLDAGGGPGTAERRKQPAAKPVATVIMIDEFFQRFRQWADAQGFIVTTIPDGDPNAYIVVPRHLPTDE